MTPIVEYTRREEFDVNITNDEEINSMKMITEHFAFE